MARQVEIPITLTSPIEETPLCFARVREPNPMIVVSEVRRIALPVPRIRKLERWGPSRKR